MSIPLSSIVINTNPSMPCRVVAIGDSITAAESAGSWFESTILKTKQRYIKAKNAGVGGNTVQQMIDRFQTDVADIDSDEVWIHAGTNNLDNTTEVVYKGQLETLVSLAKATARKVRLIAIPPKTNQIARAEKYRLVAIIVAKKYNVFFHDIWADSIDTATGGWKSGYSTDGTHPDGIAVDLASEKMVANLSSATSHNSFLPFKNEAGLGLFANPLFLIDTNADGVADGVTKAGGGSPVFTIAASDYGNWQRSEVSGTTSDGVISISAITAIAGHKYKLVCRANFVSGIGCYVVVNVQFRFSGAIVTNNYVTNTRGTFDAEIDYDFTIPASGVNQIYVQFPQNPLGGSHPANTSVMQIAQFQLYDLTALGLA